jgi:hypothetical protein
LGELSQEDEKLGRIVVSCPIVVFCKIDVEYPVGSIHRGSARKSLAVEPPFCTGIYVGVGKRQSATGPFVSSMSIFGKVPLKPFRKRRV